MVIKVSSQNSVTLSYQQLLKFLFKVYLFVSTASDDLLMIQKYPKKRYLGLRKGFKWLIIAEGVIFLSSFTLWGACNRSQNTRKFFHDTPGLKYILEFYYQTGEKIGGFEAIRKFDNATWEAQSKLNK